WYVAAFAGLVVEGDLLGEVEHLLALERGRHDVAPDVGGERAAGDVPDAAEGGEDLLGAVLAGLEHAHGRDQLRGEADEPGGAEALRGAGLARDGATVHDALQVAGGGRRRRRLVRYRGVGGDVRVRHTVVRDLVLVADGPVRAGHRLDDVGVAVHAARGDGPVHLGHLLDRRRGRAQHVGGHGVQAGGVLRQAERDRGVPRVL